MSIHAIRLTMFLALTIVAGCDQPGGAPRKVKSAIVGVDLDTSVEDAPKQPTPPPSRPILGEKTQDIKDSAKEAKNGSVEKKPTIIAKDPITLVGNAYVSIISRQATLNIQHALDLYKAENGDFPKSYDEFMDKIIKANNIALPKLPAYQEYTYIADEHRLAILEYPDRKEAMNYPK